MLRIKKVIIVLLLVSVTLVYSGCGNAVAEVTVSETMSESSVVSFVGITETTTPVTTMISPTQTSADTLTEVASVEITTVTETEATTTVLTTVTTFAENQEVPTLDEIIANNPDVAYLLIKSDTQDEVFSYNVDEEFNTSCLYYFEQVYAAINDIYSIETGHALRKSFNTGKNSRIWDIYEETGRTSFSVGEVLEYYLFDNDPVVFLSKKLYTKRIPKRDIIYFLKSDYATTAEPAPWGYLL
jgi:hypothetical protein